MSKFTLIDSEHYINNAMNNGQTVLAEGAQGYWLDVDQGDYPYVTSSNCGIGAVLNNGFSHKPATGTAPDQA